MVIPPASIPAARREAATTSMIGAAWLVVHSTGGTGSIGSGGAFFTKIHEQPLSAPRKATSTMSATAGRLFD
jgi:hypothetical protein